MQVGFDLQASLYRAMLESRGPVAEEHASLQAAAENAPRIAVLYYTLNDQTALSDGLAPGIPGLDRFEAFGDHVSEGALAMLSKKVAEVATGRVRLNGENDEKEFQRDFGIKFYALDDSPLLRIFLHRDEAVREETP